MPAVEIDHWAAFSSVEPFGPRQEEYRAGVLGSVFANAIGGAGLKPADLFPSLTPAVTRDRTGAAFLAWAASRCPALGAGPDEN